MSTRRFHFFIWTGQHISPPDARRQIKRYLALLAGNRYNPAIMMDSKAYKVIFMEVMERMSLCMLGTLLALTTAFCQSIKPVIPSNHMAAIPCDDVTALDFKNLTIHYGDRVFAFHDGVALNYDMPEVSITPDWKAEIIRDTVVQPTPGIFIHFLLVDDSHETGSGWHNWLLGYRCYMGKLQEVFHRDGLSLSIDRLDSSGITVGLNTFPCKPVRKHWAYIWDRNKSRYVLSKAWLTP